MKHRFFIAFGYLFSTPGPFSISLEGFSYWESKIINKQQLNRKAFYFVFVASDRSLSMCHCEETYWKRFCTSEKGLKLFGNDDIFCDIYSRKQVYNYLKTRNSQMMNYFPILPPSPPLQPSLVNKISAAKKINFVKINLLKTITHFWLLDIAAQRIHISRFILQICIQ